MVSMFDLTPLQDRLKHHARKLADFFPAIFFFGGFLWDALTIGRNVATSDLLIFAGYWLLAGVILFIISRPGYLLADSPQPIALPQNGFFNRFKGWLSRAYAHCHYPRLPYFLLQFIFGNLLSALFILYFKSAGHWLAWLLTFLLAGMLVANEYLEDEYQQFTLSWALFGFCAMLLFNFCLPFMVGSIHAIWFYLSTLLGAGAAYWLYKKTPNHLGSITPVGVIAGFLMLAYAADMIPPVPLVKREMAVGYALNKVEGHYQLSQQPASWWEFWRSASHDLQVVPGQRVYCFSSVFAPSGLKTRLYHRWQHYDSRKGWQTMSRIGFTLSGGRYSGFRGYTYKQQLQVGEWRVSVETENEKTVAVLDFTIREVTSPVPTVMKQY